ncbi:MAG: PIG-L family deacetylase [Gammaproteobacteria bacterium]|nr:PIG-L family deacetylase [Gammaproteobacteria bacterium]
MTQESSFIPYEAVTRLPDDNVLILAPHPDDEVFACAGAIMRHVAQENQVAALIVTDGQAARPHADMEDARNYIETRKQESREAARILGCREPVFWDIPDRTLFCDEKLIQRIAALIKELQTTRVYAPSVLEIHPDHYALAQAAIEAVSRNGRSVTLAMYEIAVPLHPNLLLDISALEERKQQAMNCFESQLSIRDYRGHIKSLNYFRTYTLEPEVSAVEGYYVLDGEQLSARPELRFGRTRQTEELEKANTRISKLEAALAAKTQTPPGRRGWWRKYIGL